MNAGLVVLGAPPVMAVSRNDVAPDTSTTIRTNLTVRFMGGLLESACRCRAGAVMDVNGGTTHRRPREGDQRFDWSHSMTVRGEWPA
ncbi:hypothetical protein GCM10011404_00460 [Sphingomonas prati]|nr:hypothetical protein GCM10011404_00460 [Sphingomonas prati]